MHTYQHNIIASIKNKELDAQRMNRFDAYITVAVVCQLLLVPIAYILFAASKDALWFTIAGMTNIWCTATIVDAFILKIVYQRTY
jgi:hypothetical protein